MGCVWFIYRKMELPYWLDVWLLCLVYIGVLPGSDAVLHMSRTEVNELSSCEVRRLNQFETALISPGSAGNNGCGPALI